jgi:hypothetical protein
MRWSAMAKTAIALRAGREWLGFEVRTGRRVERVDLNALGDSISRGRA